MAEIRPFRGLRYDPAIVGDVGKAIAPPYDVISPAAQAALYDASPYNIIRVEYARETPEQTRYQAAAATFKSWRESGALRRDRQPGFYLVRHGFDYGGRRWERRELMAAVRLAHWSEGQVLPHEATSESHKKDRLELMKACHANISPIMALYKNDGAVKQAMDILVQTAPALQTSTPGGESFDLWPVTDARAVEALRTALRGPLYVADGHHRYETALNFREIAPSYPGGGARAADHIMAALISIEDAGLFCLPYHRWLQNWPADARDRLEKQVGVLFSVEAVPIGGLPPEKVGALFFDRVEAGARPLLGLVYKGSDVMRVLRPRSPEALAKAMPRRSQAWRNLSPCLFAEALLEPALGFSQQEAETRSLLTYPLDAADAVSGVRGGRFDMAVLLDGVPLSGMAAACDAGERLPHKSTYFYPKLATGLVLNPLEGGVEDA